MNKKIIALKSKIEKIIATTEYRSQKIHGVSCSRSDQEMIVFYCDKILADGNINGLMRPMGNVGEVFAKAGIEL
jgi:hypothetical protein